MRFLSLYLIALWGWRRALLAFVLGVVSALAMAPVNLLVVLAVTMPLMVWLLDGVHAQARSIPRAMRAAARVGWCFGFGYFVAGLHWIGFAFFVDADTFAWMMPFIMTVLPAGLALFWALAFAAAMPAWSSGIWRLAPLAACLTAAEVFRGAVLTGFPWNTLGYAVAGSLELAQLAALAGIFGITFLVTLVAALPAAFTHAEDDRFGGMNTTLIGAIAMVVTIALWWTAGYQMLQQPAGDLPGQPSVRIVQPAIPQIEKWDPERRSDIFAGYLDLSDAATSPEHSGIADVDILIWPESAVPFLLGETPDALAAIAALLPERVTLLTGALRRVPPGTPDGIVHNSVLALNDDAEIVRTFDKFHLVPYGEYLPFESLLARVGFRRLVTVPASFTAGPGPQTIAMNGVPAFSPLICYEVIFPGAVIDRQVRPDWILNVTNDAWFGGSIGPYQHFEHARFRAIEQGLPLIRAANTGISGVIDAQGRVLQRLGLGERGVIDASLPQPRAPTFFARNGHLPLWALVALAYLLGLVAAAVERRRS